MNLKIFNRLESEVRGYIRSFPTVFTRARGATLWDEEGSEYIDFFAGAGTLNYGHNEPRIKQRVIEYLHSDGVVHGLDMATSAKRKFIDTFDRLVLRPRGLNYKLQFPGPTGTNAVEAALKLARQVKGRTNVISFTNGFHGVTGGSLAATGNAKFRTAAGIPLANTTFMPYDGYLAAGADGLAYIDRLLGDPSSGVDAPAAAIVETVQGEGGVNVASHEWLRGLAELCKRHDMLLIVDDIQVGCGRTGPYFSFEPAGIRPDIVTLSKSISGFGLPMSLVLLAPDLDIWSPGAHNGTFRGNNLAFESATAALELYWRDDAFTQSVKRKGAIMRNWLQEVASGYPAGEFAVRGRGMIQGLVSPRPGLCEQIASEAFNHGLVIETSGARDEVLKLLPPLTIDEDLLHKGLEIIEQSVTEVLCVPRARPQRVRVVDFRGGGR